ncbi:MAG: prolipoprotein diacylglyceryl transferase family protein, partial [Sciscionella sp.]
LYELIWDLIVAGAVVLLDRTLRLGHGRAFALYVAGYSFGRFWIELVRSDPATHILGIRINNWTMTLIFLVSIGFFVLMRRRGPREDIAALLLTHEGTGAETAEPGAGANPAIGAPAREATEQAGTARENATVAADEAPDTVGPASSTTVTGQDAERTSG